MIADIPANVVTCAPLLNRKSAHPSYLKRRQVASIDSPEHFDSIVLDMLSSPNVCNRSWIYEQYDSEVGIRTVLRPGEGDSSVLRLDDGKYIAMSIDGNSRRCYSTHTKEHLDVCQNLFVM